MRSDAARYIPFSRTDITDEDLRNLSGVPELREQDATRLVARYEKTFADATGFTGTAAVGSAMHALLVSLRALTITAGDEVILPSFASPDVGEAVEHAGASAVFADIDPQTLTVSPESVGTLIRNKTKAVIIFDTAGYTPDLAPFMQLAASAGIQVIHFTYYNPLHDYRCSGPGARPHVTVFANSDPVVRGAVIATDMEKTHASIMSLRDHGIKPSNAHRAGNDIGTWYYEITSPGFDCALSGIQGALSLISLHNAGKCIGLRRQRTLEYNSLLREAGSTLLLPPVDVPDGSHTRGLYILRIVRDALSVGRDEFIHALEEHGVGTSVHYIPLHLHPYYAKKYRYHYNTLANTYETYISAFSLPLYAGLSSEDAGYVAKTVLAVVKRYAS